MAYGDGSVVFAHNSATRGSSILISSKNCEHKLSTVSYGHPLLPE